jgi:hypothetical protein
MNKELHEKADKLQRQIALYTTSLEWFRLNPHSNFYVAIEEQGYGETGISKEQASELREQYIKILTERLKGLTDEYDRL